MTTTTTAAAELAPILTTAAAALKPTMAAATRTARLARELQRIYAEQAAHYDVCRQAEAFGVPTSLDDPRSPRTVDALRDAVKAASR